MPVTKKKKKTAGAVQNNTDRPRGETCPVCSDVIEDATEDLVGQEALFCEGTCKKWLHRWCAGVRKEGYASFSSSAEPFLSVLFVFPCSAAEANTESYGNRRVSERDCHHSTGFS